MEELLRKLLAFRTIVGDEAATRQALDFVADFLAVRGMSVARFAPTATMHEALVATTRPTKTPTIMLAAHLDVMPARDEQFTLRKQNDKLYGRGVWDMQEALAVYLQLVDELRGKLQDYDFGILITSDEELGGKDNISGFARLLEQGYIGSAYVLPDGGEEWQLETFAKGYMHYTLEFHGKAAHGSRPWEGDNAIARLVDTLADLKSHFHGHGPDTDTINLGIVKGGEIVNKIPHYAVADIEMRLNDTDSSDKLRKLVETVCARHGAQPTPRAYFPPITNSLDNLYLQAFAASIHKVTGVANHGHKSYGGTDARFLSQRGIPCALVRPPGGDFHGANEWLSEAGFYQLKAVIGDFLKHMARHPDKTNKTVSLAAPQTDHGAPAEELTKAAEI